MQIDAVFYLLFLKLKYYSTSAQHSVLTCMQYTRFLDFVLRFCIHFHIIPCSTSLCRKHIFTQGGSQRESSQAHVGPV